MRATNSTRTDNPFPYTRLFRSREEPQPGWVTATPEMRFKYGSIGAENEAGIPYWIFYVLPRMFPEKLPGPGGYAAFGVAWEAGQELPVRSEEHTSELQSLMRISYAVFCLKKKKKQYTTHESY